ncbi:c-type cytochrome [Aquimarina sp. 2-A2]|uniref:c-type cytochrome n=1 Tax=Aquimarina sp. 2-A2 TaxID=3382644 RepID=UPI00387EFB92
MSIKPLLLMLLCLSLFVSCQPAKKEKETITIGKKSSSRTAFDKGKEIFMGKGRCFTCHLTDKKSIGPSVHKIMQVYNEQNGNLVAFLKQDAEPIVEPENYAVMKTNFAIIKHFSEEELSNLETYMKQVSAKKSTP